MAVNQDYTELLEELLDSIVKLDLLVFFHTNQGAMDNASGLAMWVGHEVNRVQQAAEELSAAHILEKWGEDNPVYYYTSDANIVQTVEEFVRTKVIPKEERARLLQKIINRNKEVASV